MDYMIIVPGQSGGGWVMSAMNLQDARSIVRDMLGVQRLPKGTTIKRYSESDWN